MQDKKLSGLERVAKLKDNPIVQTAKEFDRIDDTLESISQEHQNIGVILGELEGTKADKSEIDELNSKIENVKTIKGEDGKDGKDGINGVDGKDGLNGKDGIDGLDGINGVDGKDGVDGIDGKDGSPDTPDQVIEKIHKSKKLIKKDKIEGLDELERKTDFALNRPIMQGVGGGASGIREIRAGTNIGVSNTNEVVTVRTVDNPTFDSVKIDTTATPATSAPGLIQWNSVDGTYDMGLLNSSVLQVGQETMFYGKASGAIANGDLCQFAGVQGDHILVKKAVGSEIEDNPHYLVGVATENIANGTFGYITWFGKINGIYTKTPNNQDDADWVAGDTLYFNVTTGQMTKTMPSVPNRIITVASVIKEQTGASESGIIIVRPTIGCKLQDLDDVNGSPPVRDGQIPIWNNTGKYFDFEGDVDLGANDLTVGSSIITTVPAITNLTSAQVNDVGGSFQAYGLFYSFNVFALVGGVWSEVASTGLTDDASEATFNIQLNWDAVTGATNYRVVVTSDHWNGYYGEVYKDTLTNSLLYTGAFDVYTGDYSYMPSPISPLITCVKGLITGNNFHSILTSEFDDTITAKKNIIIKENIIIEGWDTIIGGTATDFADDLTDAAVNIYGKGTPATINTYSGMSDNYWRISTTSGEGYIGVRCGQFFLQSDNSIGPVRIEDYGGGLGGMMVKEILAFGLVTPYLGVQFNDNIKANFGTGKDSTIYHTGTNWEFDVDLATAAIRFNPGLINTDFQVFGNNRQIFQLDAQSGTSYIRANTDSTTAFQLRDAGSTVTLNHDSTNNRIGIGTTAPSDKLDVLGTARFGDHTTNYSQFETDGTYKMVGTATVYDDVNYSIETGKVAAANAPTWSAFTGNLFAYKFAVNDYIDLGVVEMPHSYKEGSNFEMHVHWATNGTNVDARGVKWELEYAIQNDSYTSGIGPAWSAATVVSAETTIPANTPTLSGGYTSVTTVTGTGIKMGSTIMVRLRRIASTGTAPTADPFGLQVGIHFEKDTVGSRTTIAK